MELQLQVSIHIASGKHGRREKPNGDGELEMHCEAKGYDCT